MAKIAIISGDVKTLVNFRGELIKGFIKKGHRVIAMAPDGNLKNELYSIGAVFYHIPLHRTGLNLFKDSYTLFSIIRVLKRERPEIVLSYNVKPVIYGSLAARITKVPRIYSMITGLGYAFVEDSSLRRRLLSVFLKFLYNCALKKNEKVFFQNPDDLELFKTWNLLTDDNAPVLINGSGVDVNKFKFVKPKLQPLSFLLAARLIWDKGIGDFVEAARILKPRYPQVYFKILGPFDINPSAISPEMITSWMIEGVIKYLGETDDVRPYIAEASVFVLPSFYREGTPRSILEAMSMGRPIITTDVPGCRETVLDGINGFLVPAKSPVALAETMEKFILNPRLIMSMGVKSRRIADRKYDVHKVNQVIMEAMRLVKENENNF